MSKKRTYAIEVEASVETEFEFVEGTSFWVDAKDRTLVVYDTDENGVRRRVAAFAAPYWRNITEWADDDEDEKPSGIDIDILPGRE